MSRSAESANISFYELQLIFSISILLINWHPVKTFGSKLGQWRVGIAALSTALSGRPSRGSSRGWRRGWSRDWSRGWRRGWSRGGSRGQIRGEKKLNKVNMSVGSRQTRHHMNKLRKFGKICTQTTITLLIDYILLGMARSYKTTKLQTTMLRTIF